MAIIKSAWEIAMEKTESLEADPKKIAHDLKVREGRQIAASYLMDIDVTEQQTAEKLKAYKNEEDAAAVREGMGLTLLANISLPHSEMETGTSEKLTKLGKMLAPHDKQVAQIIGQLAQFFTQYLQNQNDMVERMKQQYAPRLEQKQAQLRQQYGQDVVIRPEQDAEFMKLLDKSLAQLDDQYTNVLNQAKDQLKELLHLE